MTQELSKFYAIASIVLTGLGLLFALAHTYIRRMVNSMVNFLED